MRYGFVLPKGDARTAADLAYEAEQSGWDGFFMWEPVWGIDPWVSLAAAAMKTEHIRLGTMLTPISIRKPWKLASETATLDNLSGGRVILSVGLGAPDTGFACFGEPIERKLRAELMDEALTILTGLWRGQPFNFTGKHYHLSETTFNPPPPPLQQPRIPIWVVGAHPSRKSMQRALAYDGLLPAHITPEGKLAEMTPELLAQISQYIAQQRQAPGPYEIVQEGTTPGTDHAAAAAIVRPWAQAGATWWIEAAWAVEDLSQLRQRLRQGPPRID
jgi:alkanesulfonate monooxygenase SsuD/methylene tetrahydromethanopterin reductase-like flavin-dependent oxidoreductase (luciferase family)